MNIPENHQAVMPYLMVNKAEDFIKFAQEVFGASLNFKRMRPDEITIMHAELQINGSTIMFCEATTDWLPQTANLFVYVPDADATYQKAIDLDATTVMELSDQDYGRTCGVKDSFGNIWWITSAGH
ncbi:MAG: VOC family protein [Chitinophagales bacterium]